MFYITWLVNSILQTGGTKCLRLPGHPQLYPRQLSSVVVLFLCVVFVSKALWKIQSKGKMKDSNLILLQLVVAILLQVTTNLLLNDLVVPPSTCQRFNSWRTHRKARRATNARPFKKKWSWCCSSSAVWTWYREVGSQPSLVKQWETLRPSMHIIECMLEACSRELPNDQRRDTQTAHFIGDCSTQWFLHYHYPWCHHARGVRGNERHVKMPWRKRCQMGDQQESTGVCFSSKIFTTKRP